MKFESDKSKMPSSDSIDASVSDSNISSDKSTDSPVAAEGTEIFVAFDAAEIPGDFLVARGSNPPQLRKDLTD